MTTTVQASDIAHVRAQLTLLSQRADKAFERAFDLQQAGAPSDRVDAALAEVVRLQDAVRALREQVPEPALLH
ncbi:hypothetical protein [Ramlibacter albus]|uniref:Uncharacterized protein n=1 Tax=Ramlibacter albus TaxID=2079448 RepID=A0A923MCL5_9BURK|nr:hypothetical protein [Ramlibacter albus]MBC5768225.1 hypothetical protein [Ramlibacter albus]